MVHFKNLKDIKNYKMYFELNFYKLKQVKNLTHRIIVGNLIC